MLPSTVTQIKENLVFILDEVIQSRQYLNKHFQNSMNNYFLENYATQQSLKRHFKTYSGRQVRKQVFQKYSVMYQNDAMPKCFVKMKGFAEEHRLHKSLEEYRKALVTLANDDKSDSIEKGCQEWISLQWRRLFSLMVLHHTYYLNIQGVYELWFHVFNERLLEKDKLNYKKDEFQQRIETAPYIILELASNKKDGCANDTRDFNLETTSSSQPAMTQVDPLQISKRQENIIYIFKTKASLNSSKKTQKKSNVKKNSQNSIISEKEITHLKKCDYVDILQNHHKQEVKIDYEPTKKRKTEDTIRICRDENENQDYIFFKNSLSLPEIPPICSNSQSFSDFNQTLKEETHFQPIISSNEQTNSNLSCIQSNSKVNSCDSSPYEEHHFPNLNFPSSQLNNDQHLFPFPCQQNSVNQPILSYQQQAPTSKLSQTVIPKQQQQQQNFQQIQCYSSAKTQTSNYQDYFQTPNISREFQQFNLESVIPQQQDLLQQQQLRSYSPSPITNPFPSSSPQPIQSSSFAPLFTLANNSNKANDYFLNGCSQSSSRYIFEENSSFPNLQIENWMYHSQLGFLEEDAFFL